MSLSVGGNGDSTSRDEHPQMRSASPAVSNKLPPQWSYQERLTFHLMNSSSTNFTFDTTGGCRVLDAMYRALGRGQRRKKTGITEEDYRTMKKRHMDAILAKKQRADPDVDPSEYEEIPKEWEEIIDTNDDHEGLKWSIQEAAVSVGINNCINWGDSEGKVARPRPSPELDVANKRRRKTTAREDNEADYEPSYVAQSMARAETPATSLANENVTARDVPRNLPDSLAALQHAASAGSDTVTSLSRGSTDAVQLEQSGNTGKSSFNFSTFYGIAPPPSTSIRRETTLVPRRSLPPPSTAFSQQAPRQNAAQSKVTSAKVTTTTPTTSDTSPAAQSEPIETPTTTMQIKTPITSGVPKAAVDTTSSRPVLDTQASPHQQTAQQQVVQQQPASQQTSQGSEANKQEDPRFPGAPIDRGIIHLLRLLEARRDKITHKGYRTPGSIAVINNSRKLHKVFDPVLGKKAECFYLDIHDLRYRRPRATSAPEWIPQLQ